MSLHLSLSENRYIKKAMASLFKIYINSHIESSNLSRMHKFFTDQYIHTQIQTFGFFFKEYSFRTWDGFLSDPLIPPPFKVSLGENPQQLSIIQSIRS